MFETIFFPILSLIAGIIIGVFATFLLFKYIGLKKINSAENKAEKIKKQAKEEADEIKNSTNKDKELFHKEKQKYEKDLRERRAELNRFESRLLQKEENLEKRLAITEQKENILGAKERELENKYKEIDDTKIKLQNKIENVANLSQEQAKELIIKQVEKEAETTAFKLANKIEEEARIGAERKAKEIIVNSIQRIASEIVGDVCVTTVSLPSDEMKGRIIGREGRNIRTLEYLTGVDIIIDDTPEAVVISCFDPVRREIAKISLDRLVVDGRIHPSRIEEIVDKVNVEIENNMLEDGEKACMDLGITGIHIELQKQLGKLKYRTSYGQNVFYHSIEVAQLSGLMASQLGADIDICKRAGLLHDIGKAVSVDRFGGHAVIGSDLAKHYGESHKVVNAISSHHNDTEPECIEAVIIQAADAISASRPGARRESFESYIKRLETLEKIANQYNGVEKAYAIQAGREVRIIVNHENLDDLNSKKLAKDIANRIEEEVKYPGQIKVTVIREMRIIEYAK